MIFDLNDPRQYLEATEYLQEAASKHWVVTLARKIKPKTTRQNNYLHFLCQYYATQYGCTASEAKEIHLKRYAAPGIFREYVENQKGVVIERYRSVATLSAAEISSAIRNFIDWALSQGGIELPEPDDMAFRRHAEKEIERCQYWI